MKQCAKCKTDKEEKEFNKKRNGLSSYCKTCQSSYWADYYSRPDRKKKHIARSADRSKLQRRKMAQLLDSLKNVPCKDCQIPYQPWVMQFDHLPGSFKKMEVSKMTGYSELSIREEIAKCDIVCANCHATRTHDRLGKVADWIKI